jgi:prepilin-type N-terminal cleavage/methylation domain
MSPECRHRKSAGFTLIELIIVVTIIGLLAGIAIVNVKNAQRKASEQILKADLAQMRKAIDDFYADKQRYPSSLNEIVEAGYMRRLPADPITKSSDTWVELPEEVDPDKPDAPLTSSDMESHGPGIVDVKSGAEGSTLDNVPYNEL